MHKILPISIVLACEILWFSTMAHGTELQPGKAQEGGRVDLRCWEWLALSRAQRLKPMLQGPRPHSIAFWFAPSLLQPCARRLLGPIDIPPYTVTLCFV